ncbi:hypothetical protein AU255_09725 [Methyloprofundus sedimenti]|uniref:Uncharacterized protein n=1 Tax=Methyloprofundus sedimenti TaxID=1420851 RepID=A0A1V8M933_9GAMM|nr:hypothetical protein AU255_09725 [Methyloprofundus sedimenti]
MVTANTFTQILAQGLGRMIITGLKRYGLGYPLAELKPRLSRPYALRNTWIDALSQETQSS